MAPLTFEDRRPIKRSSSTAGFDDHGATKRKREDSAYQKITGVVNGAQSRERVALDSAVAETLLTRSISLALDVVGFEASEPLALESFRMGVEEYMHRFAAHVRQSMLSCRRTQPTAQDFLQALHKHQLSLKALLPHLEPPVPRRRARIVLPYEPVEEEEQYDHHFIGVTLDDTPTKQDLSSMPSHLPPLPSKHTYKATAEYPEREEDPRKIRERATEEGRLGEEALRRLVSAKLTDRLSSSRAGHGVKSMRTKRDELWKGAMDATSAQNLSEHPQHDESMQLDVSQHAAGLSKQLGFNHGRVSSAVNADKKFWRKPAPAQGSSQSNSRGVT